jgi:SAM-dependent methyltransferase
MKMDEAYKLEANENGGLKTALEALTRERFAKETETDRRAKLIGLLRGYFACPVISSLGEIGIADAMLEGPFSVADFAHVIEENKLHAIFRYLHGIGIIVPRDSARYDLTGIGRTAVARNGAFSLLASYAEYFSELSSYITGKRDRPSVNRLLNVRGSGQLHGRKFFPAALELLEDNPPKGLIDVGCGDGCFLQHACNNWPELEIFGVDLSEDAVRTTELRMCNKVSRGGGAVAVACDGFEVETWSKNLPEELRSSTELTISMWFVAHEFSQGLPRRVVDFFYKLHDFFPTARVVLGEICNIPPHVLASNHESSIMPEYLLFHELSGQGVLAWEDWNQILASSPYQVQGERRFDEVKVSGGTNIPASFVWVLAPAG